MIKEQGLTEVAPPGGRRFGSNSTAMICMAVVTVLSACGGAVTSPVANNIDIFH
jgi:hypothetical protein